MRFFNRTAPPEVPEVEEPARPVEPEKAVNKTQHPDDGFDSDAISGDAQEGVKDIEAMTKVWSKSHLIAAYVLIWIIYFVNSMQEGTANLMSVHVTSSFASVPLTATTGVVSSLVGGLFRLPLAKIIDLWGRPQGYFLMVCCMTIGLIMMAACQNVETYAAAQVFYWVGYNGFVYIISVFVSDTSSLKNRGLMFAYVSSPYIITTWINGRIADAFLNGPGFRWSFGAFAIIVPFMMLTLWALMMYNYRKAKKLGVLVPRKASGRTTLQSLSHYVQEFDIVGVLILAAGLALFLLAFNIYTYQSDGWRSPLIICFLVFGVLLMAFFAVWEKYLARCNFIPFELLKDRTCLGAFIVSGSVFISFYLWDSYFYAFILVVNNLNTVNANYVLNIYTIGSCVWSFVIGWAIRASGRFKWIAVYFAIPFTILGAGLMIAFREPNQDIGLIVMCQIFIAVAGGGVVITEQVAALAATSHQYIAVVLAVESMFSSIGGAIGSTIATAIWTGIFPGKLGAYLPAEEQGNLTTIYGSTDVQLSYPVGSDTRIAIQRAYGETQKLMLIAATAVLVIPWIAAACWRDINVKNFKQTKGNVI
ncbi:siderophore iron transporter mirb [Seiridium cupressi]